MLQQYFTTAWVPRNNGTNNFYTANLGNGVVAIGYKSQPVLVQPGQTDKLQSTLWVGPAIQDKMAAVAPHLDLTVDYGWLWFISQPLFKLLKFIHSFLGNWGFSIIVITFIVRGIMYPLTKRSTPPWRRCACCSRRFRPCVSVWATINNVKARR